ncbi:hypothetical protein ACFSE1_18070 [Rhizobium helianthi]|uniref:DUF4123 domain-containing protein n=1 Tax=Rhizobium helianthi TaxID=1132695 RepID=A0ABW4M7G5_9HYPH
MDAVATDKPNLSQPGQACLATLVELVHDPSRRVYAVIEGARLPNIAAKLSQIDVAHRPLYRAAPEHYDVVAGGPWLINPMLPARPTAVVSTPPPGEPDELSDEALRKQAALLSEQMVSALQAGDQTAGGMLPEAASPDPEQTMSRLKHLLAFCDDASAIVFWIGDASLTEEVLYRHLRSINKIIIPSASETANFSRKIPETNEDIAGEEREPTEAVGKTEELVVFRHADPDVMMQILPVLDLDQAVRLFGPADQIVFGPAAIWGGGVKRARRPSDAVSKARWLHLTGRNLSDIRDTRVLAARYRRIAVFRRSAPHLLEGMNDRQALAFMERHEAQAREIGLKTERGFFQWTYLMSASNDEFIRSPEIGAYIKTGNPDARLDDIMLHMANGAKEGRQV